MNLDDLCSGYSDCIDGSDESKELCDTIDCPEDHYRCPNWNGSGRMCLSEYNLCNRDADCEDGSDEDPEVCRQYKCLDKGGCDKLECSHDEFTCKQLDDCACPICIPKDKVCDYESDCPRSSDEDQELCRSIGCQPSVFQCPNATKRVCQPWDSVCDSWFTCAEGGDETPEACALKTCQEGEYRCSNFTSGDKLCVKHR